MYKIDKSYRIHDWSEISDLGWNSLLLGNGFSINIYDGFRYSNLAVNAQGIVSEKAQALLDETSQGNFEEALGQLAASEKVLSTLGMDNVQRVSEAYLELSLNLLECVSDAHISWSDLGTRRKHLIANSLVKFDRVYTTNYDLIPYWSILASRASLKKECGKFMVDFMSNASAAPSEDTLAFNHLHNPDDIKGPRFFYLHGALHLWTDESGRTGKWRRSDNDRSELPETLDDLRARYPNSLELEPLFVSEGSAERKISKISGNGYLSHCLSMLQEDTKPTVIIGSSLGASDEHIRQALADGRGEDNSIAFGVHNGLDNDEATALMAHVEAAFGSSCVLFFDSSTHPLSGRELSAEQSG